MSEDVNRRDITSKEEAIEFLREMESKNSELSKEEKLQAIKIHNDMVSEMTRIFDSLPRRRKRKIMNQKMKYSNLVKKRLK